MAWNLKTHQLKDSLAQNEVENSRKKNLLCELCSMVAHFDNRPKQVVLRGQNVNKKFVPRLQLCDHGIAFIY